MIKDKQAYTVAVSDATGIVGRELIEVLEERMFPVGELVLLASEGSEGERLEFRGTGQMVRRLARGSFAGSDLAFFCGGAGQARSFVPDALASGAVVIDLSGAFSNDPKVPLIVPGLNADAMANHGGIVAGPSPGTVAAATALRPLHGAAGVVRSLITAFEPASGSGKQAMDELAGQTVALLNFRDVPHEVFRHQLAFNCLPRVGDVLDDGSTTSETRMVREVRRVLNAPGLRVGAMAVRVPVFRGYAISLNVETERPLPPNEARALLSAAPGVVVFDDPRHDVYPLQIDVVGKNEVFIGRIRKDDSVPNGLSLWVACDDLRAGSAQNAVEIAERLVRK
jgi:aspartate-semialdehyde dehydrogenase